MIFDALWRALRHGTAESPPECAQNVCRERPLQSTWTITNIAKPRFSQNLQKITKNQRFLDVIIRLPLKENAWKCMEINAFSENQNPWHVRRVFHQQITQISARIRRKHAVQSQCRADPRNWKREINDFHRNHPKIHQSHRSRDVIWVRLSQIEQESAKISRTHALGSNTEMSARKLVKADEIEHRNNQNAQPGGNWTSTFIHLGNEFSIINVKMRTKGSILDIQEGPHVNFQGSSPSS